MPLKFEAIVVALFFVLCIFVTFLWKRRSIGRLCLQIGELKSRIESYRRRIPHEAEDLFDEVKWLRSALSEIHGAYAIPSLEAVVNLGLFKIQFRPTESVSLQSRKTSDQPQLYRGNGIHDYEMVYFSVNYFVVWNFSGVAVDSGDRVSVQCWPTHLGSATSDPNERIGDVVARIEKYRSERCPNEKIRYIAVIRTKQICSNFGKLTGCDVYEFPEEWQPSATERAERIQKFAGN